jgi:hypothetical protein
MSIISEFLEVFERGGAITDRAKTVVERRALKTFG